MHHRGALAVLVAGGAIALVARAAPPEASGAAWLDAGRPASWNAPGREVPAAPAPRGEAASTARCRSAMRESTLASDRAVARKGWTLFGPAQVFGDAEVVLAAASVDGMCRPVDFQGFVFAGGKLAGTVSPVLMSARTDGAAGRVFLRSAARLEVEFARYAPQDPLCCPSRVTLVTYAVERTPGDPVLVPAEARTSPSPR